MTPTYGTIDRLIRETFGTPDTASRHYLLDAGNLQTFAARVITETVFIDVCRKDEAAVREWLAQQFRHTAKLWEPFLPQGSGQ